MLALFEMSLTVLTSHRKQSLADQRGVKTYHVHNRCSSRTDWCKGIGVIIGLNEDIGTKEQSRQKKQSQTWWLYVVGRSQVGLESVGRSGAK